MSDNNKALIDYSGASKVAEATNFISDCYTEMAKYVAVTRAYCSVVDGFKSVYRRTLYASRGYKNLVKSASIVGDGIKYHPHGDGNIYGALVSMTCKYGRFPLFKGKGNFGGLGSAAAAMRYTEATVNDIARFMYLDLVDYAEMIEGEAGYKEPKYLPSLLPYALLVGSGGIPVGLPGAKIPKVDIMGLIDYYIDTLNGVEEPLAPLPDFGKVYIDLEPEKARKVINTGSGKLWFKPMIMQEDEGIFVITDMTPDRSIDKVLNKLSWYLDNEYVDYSDESSNSMRYVFEIVDKSKITPDELLKIIDRALSSSCTYKYIFADQEGHATYCGLPYLVEQNLNYLRGCVVRKYTSYVEKHKSKIEVFDIIERMKTETDIVSRMCNMTTEDVKQAIVNELGCDYSVASQVTPKPMSYLTKSHGEERDRLNDELSTFESYMNNPDIYLLEKYNELKVLLKPKYDEESHSVVGLVQDISAVSQCEMYATLNNDNTITITEEPIDDTSVKYHNSLFVVREDGWLEKKLIKAMPGSVIDLDTEKDGRVRYIASASDTYLVVLSWSGTGITVLKSADLPKSKQVVKLKEEDTVSGILSTSSSTIEIEKSNETMSIELESWIKKRVSKPSWLGKGDFICVRIKN